MVLRSETHSQQVGGYLVVFTWAFGGIKVKNTFTTGRHLVVFRWAFGGIQVGKTWSLLS